jgi:hypothetical protein
MNCRWPGRMMRIALAALHVEGSPAWAFRSASMEALAVSLAMFPGNRFYRERSTTLLAKTGDQNW